MQLFCAKLNIFIQNDKKAISQKISYKIRMKFLLYDKKASKNLRFSPFTFCQSLMKLTPSDRNWQLILS
jgi:hypothetical protein